MNNNIRRIARHRQKESAIYKSTHDPFLLGNIVKGGVIETISRKAISPLADQITSFSIFGTIVLPLKLLSHPIKWGPDISYLSGNLSPNTKREEYPEYQKFFLTPPLDSLRYN